MKFVILLSVALFAVVSAVEEIPILRNDQSVEVDGFSYNYETGNGIAGEASGTLKNAGTDQEALAVQGQYSYTNDDGTVEKISYIADENGYQPQGDSIPLPPPIPEAIVRALKYIAEHPPPPSKK